MYFRTYDKNHIETHLKNVWNKLFFLSGLFSGPPHCGSYNAGTSAITQSNEFYSMLPSTWNINKTIFSPDKCVEFTARSDSSTVSVSWLNRPTTPTHTNTHSTELFIGVTCSSVFNMKAVMEGSAPVCTFSSANNKQYWVKRLYKYFLRYQKIMLLNKDQSTCCWTTNQWERGGIMKRFERWNDSLSFSSIWSLTSLVCVSCLASPLPVKTVVFNKWHSNIWELCICWGQLIHILFYLWQQTCKRAKLQVLTDFYSGHKKYLTFCKWAKRGQRY